MPLNPKNQKSFDEPEAIEATAAVWLSLRDRGMNEAETAEFIRWLQQTPRHAEVFAELDLVWKQFNSVAALRPSESAVPEPELLAPRRRRPARSSRAAWVALAAAAAVAIGFLGYRSFAVRSPLLQTAVGAYQKIDLPDGSIVQLNTDSALEVNFTTAERRVKLTRGEAHFTVTKNPARPFVVAIGSVAVRAVGTAFNIRRRDEAVEVLVTEGRVELHNTENGKSLLGPTQTADPSLLVAGERAIVATPADEVAQVVPIEPVEVGRALAWQERRLEFDAMPLGEVVAEFNRYNQTKLVIADPRLSSKRLTGTFRADGFEPFVRLLEENFGITASRAGNEIRLQRAP